MQRTITVTTPNYTSSTIRVYSNLLGKGTNGAVHLSQSTDENKTLLAVKIIGKRTENEIQCTKKEIQIMKYLTDLKNQNIVQLYGTFVSDKHDYIAMTYAINGPLSDWTTGTKYRLTFQEKMQIMGGIANGLAFMHRLNIIHCDIKPGNVLLDAQMNPILADFGHSKRYGVDNFSDIQGTSLFYSPELLLAKYWHQGPGCHSEKSDIYAFSLLCWCIIAQAKNPFEFVSKDANEFITAVVTNKEIVFHLYALGMLKNSLLKDGTKIQTSGQTLKQR